MCAKVKLKLLLIFTDIIGKKEIEYEASTVKEVIDKFLAEYKENFEEKEKISEQIFNEETGYFKDWMLILINGRNIKFLDGLETKLKDKDVIVLSPPMAGG